MRSQILSAGVDLTSLLSDLYKVLLYNTLYSQVCPQWSSIATTYILAGPEGSLLPEVLLSLIHCCTDFIVTKIFMLNQNWTPWVFPQWDLFLFPHPPSSLRDLLFCMQFSSLQSCPVPALEPWLVGDSVPPPQGSCL